MGVDLEAIKARLAAVPPGVIQPDGLTWTRLSAEGGALHTGGDGGIVYSACEVASIDLCPVERDPAMALIASAPADVAALALEVERLRGFQIRVLSACDEDEHHSDCPLAYWQDDHEELPDDWKERCNCFTGQLYKWADEDLAGWIPTYWQQFKTERDQAQANWKDQEAMLDKARESIGEALDGVPEYDEHAGWWWEGALKAIRALRQS